MAVFINELEGNYTMIPNALITDLRISPNEFRLYCYLRSKPGTWKINNTDIQKRLGVKTRATLSGYWKKLMELELIKRERSSLKQGKFTGYDYKLLPYSNSPCMDQPCTVGTDTERDRHGANHTHSNTDFLNKKEKLNNTNKNIMSETKISDDRDDLSPVEDLLDEEEKRKKVAAKKEKVEDVVFPTFEDFWNVYDKKVGKKEKIKSKWLQLKQNTKHEIITHVHRYKESQPNKAYRKNPETYLNNESWNDEIIFNKPIQNPQQKFSRQTEETIIKNSQGW